MHRSPRIAAAGDREPAAGDVCWLLVEMNRNVSIALYLVALIVVVVGVDLLFFRHHVLERLIVNIGIVLVFLAFYFRFLNRT